MRTTISPFSRAACLSLVLLPAIVSPMHAAEPKWDEAVLIAVLESDAPAAEKAITCKRLAVSGTAAAVPALSALLPDPELCSWARIALEAIPGEAADKAFRQALQTVTGRELIGVVNSLGVRRDQHAVAALARLLQDEQHTSVAPAAALSLGRIGDAAAADVLTEALADARPAVRSAAAEGCLLAAERLLADNKKKAAAMLYEKVRKADVPQQRTLEATRGVILADDAQRAETLMATITAADEELLAIGLSTARELAEPAVTRTLVALLKRLPADRQSLLLKVLADRGDESALAAVMGMTASEDPQVRISALNAVAQLGNAESVQQVIEIASQATAPEVALAAQEALRELPGDDVDKTLVNMASTAEGRRLQLILEAIGARRIAAPRILARAMDNDDGQIRSAAFHALGLTASANDLLLLIDRIVKPRRSGEDIDSATAALRIAARRMPSPAETVRLLEEAMAEAPSSAKASLLEIVSAIGGAEALRVVHAAAQSDDAQLQDVASKELGEWMTADAAPVLLDLAQHLQDPRLQTRAVRGYIRIARQFVDSDEERLEMCQQAWQVAQRDAERELALAALAQHANLQLLRLAINAPQEAFRKEAAQTIGNKLINDKPRQRSQVEKLLRENDLD